MGIGLALLASQLLGMGLANHTRPADAIPVCTCIPSTAAVAAAFDLAGTGRLGPGYPKLPRIGVDSAIVPPSLLKAVGWVESNWRQFDGQNVPLLSFDFGYGIMQITSGMAGASGDPVGSLPLSVQGGIGGDYTYNIAYGARMLAENFNAMPAVGERDPTALEDWYYALWAYNGWGWVNNPNNPRFTRVGTPATDPGAFPYQERVYYWVEHPPLDAFGHSLWPAMRVTLPSDSEIGDNPGPIRLRRVHHEVPHLYGATYELSSGPTAMSVGSSVSVHVRIYNTGGLPWAPSGGPAYALTYHWVVPGHKRNPHYDPHLRGIDVLDGSFSPLSNIVPVGGSVRVAIHVQAPTTTGTLKLEWDMEGREPGWFTYNGVSPGVQDVQLVPRGDYAPPYSDPRQPTTLRGHHVWFVSLTSGPVATTLSPGEAYSETMLMFNPGKLAWERRYKLQLIGASALAWLPLKVVPACHTVPVTINGRAPHAIGLHDQRWRMVAADGRFFGPTFDVRFTVVSSPGNGVTRGGRLVNRLI